MNIKHVCIFLLTASFFGCDEDKVVAITDSSVYAEMTARFTKSTNTTIGTCSFWEGSRGGRRLIFHGSAKLSFNDVIMNYNNVDYSYYKSLVGFRTPSSFKIVDVNNKTFDNSIAINSVELPATTSLDTISSSSPLTIAWNGSVLETHETVTLRIAGVGAEQNVVGSNSVTFSLSDFSAITVTKPAEVDLSIERSKILPLTMDLGGSGTIKAEYIAQTKKVILK